MTMASSGTLLGAQGPLWMQTSWVLLSFRIGNRISSSIWKSFSTDARASEAQVKEQLWKEYVADPSQWWDNRIGKVYCGDASFVELVLESLQGRKNPFFLRMRQINPRSPDFRHKITRKSLWVDGWSTPVWVKAVLQGELHPHVDHHTHNPQDTAWSNRSLKKNNRGGSSQSTYARESRQNIQVDDARMPMQSAITVSEAIAVLNNHIQEGIIIDSHTYVAVLQRCFRQKDFTSAKQVHDCITRSGVEQNIYVANNMMRVYIRCGKLQEAREVFDRLVRKSVFSWTIMIGGYTHHDRAMDAYEMFNQMRQEGAQPNEVTYLCILKACADPVALKWGKEVHAHIIHGGFQSDLRVGTALLKMYAKCGRITEAREVFDNLTNRDLIAWTVMIGAYAEFGCGHEAYELFLRMQREGYKPDAYIFTSLLNQRSSAGALEWVKDVHAHAVKAGLELDVRVANVLINMYAKCGFVENARQVFDRMGNRDVISWNVTIGAYTESGRGAEAYQLFLQMQREGFTPDAFTYLGILNPKCASVGSLEWVKEVHTTAHNAGLDKSVYVGTALVGIYATARSTLDDAREVFDQMVRRDVTSWNVMIGAYAEHGCGAQAYQLFFLMQQEGFTPDRFTFLSILRPCADVGVLEWVRKVHVQVLQAGLGSDLWVGNALIHVYAKSGSVEDARLVFEGLVERDVITWNAMIGGYAGTGRGHEAYELFLQMQREGVLPNATTYLSLLNERASVGGLKWVKQAHRHACEGGLESDLRVGNALIHMYAKSGSLDDARLVFDRMVERDIITYNVMIGALAQHGFGREALQVHKQIGAECLQPSGHTFVAVLSACSHAGLVDEGRLQFLAMTQEYGITPSVMHYTCMVDVLGRAGRLKEAKLFIQNMPMEPDGATWGALLGACRNHGNVELAEHAAKERFLLEPKDASAYVLLSNVYASAGKWNQVALVRSLMKERGLRKEPGRSWIEVDDQIHHFVVGDTSHPETEEVYAELSRLSEKIKAEGYIPDTRLVLHNIEEKDKELALCSHSEKLAIAYGILRIPLGEPIRVHNNLRMCSDCHTATKFISKVTEREIVARDANRFHHFKAGICSCGDYW